MSDSLDVEALIQSVMNHAPAQTTAQGRTIAAALQAMGTPTSPEGGLGLFLPRASVAFGAGRAGRAPIDYVGVYLVLSDYYVDGENGISGDTLADYVVRLFCAQAPRLQLIEMVTILGRALDHHDFLDKIVEEHRAVLGTEVRQRFDRAIMGERRVVLAPQVVLGSLRLLLAMDDVPLSPQCPAEILLLRFAHAVAQRLSASGQDSGDMMGGLPVRLAMEMVCNAAFNERGDTYSALARHKRLWSDYSSAGQNYLGGRTPAELALAATGLEVEDFLALGFAFTANAMCWEPGKPIYIPTTWMPDFDPSKVERFLDLVSLTPAEMRSGLSQLRSRWDFLAFQQHPVLRTEKGLLVVDWRLLFERVTTGLFWDVHDHLAATEGDASRLQWTQKWGDIVEAMVEDELASLAPIALGGQKTIWDEDDLAAAYGSGTKHCDQVIDAGRALVATDIVSGQLKVATRIDGDPQAFREDLEKLVFKKIRQVNETAKNLIADEQRLTGIRPNPPRPVYPVVAIGSTFSRSPTVARLIEEQCKGEGLFTESLICRLSVIDVSEVEQLEGLAAVGYSLPDLLDGWHASGVVDMSLRNYLIEKFGNSYKPFRSPKLQGRVEALMVDLYARFGMDPDEAVGD